MPNFAISGFSSLGNPNASNPFDFRHNLYDQSVNLTWIKGTHSLRFGEEYFGIMLANFQSGSSYGGRGGFTFSGGLTALSGGPAPNLYNAWGDFLLGLPTALGKDTQNINPAVMKENIYSFYANDQWQVSRKLTVSYGVRYEIYPFEHSNHGLGGISYDWNTNIVNFGGFGGVPYNAGIDTGHGVLGPRVGFAYRLTPRTVIRAGYGINPNNDNFHQGLPNFPMGITAVYNGANSYSAAGSLVSGIPLSPPVSIQQGTLPLPSIYSMTAYEQKFRRGYAIDYNFTVQRNLGKDFILQAAFVGTRDIRELAVFNLNAATAPGTGKAGQPYYAKFGNANSISQEEPSTTTNYNSLQLNLTRRVGKSTVGASYTYSKALDWVEGLVSTVMWSLPAMRQRNYALASFDRPHNFEAYWVYDLPFGKNQHWLGTGLGARIAGGWRMAGILTRGSGLPFTVSTSATSLNSPGNTQTANQVVPKVQILGGHGTNQPYFDPNAFAPVTTATFGSTGRNIMRGPGLFNLNGGLYRTFSLTERFKLQFRADAYGLTNSPVFGNPSATVSNATFSNGVVTSLNGYDTITSSTGQRVVQFALKLTF